MPGAVADLDRGGGDAARVADDEPPGRVQPGQLRVCGPGGDHAGAAGRRQARTALEGADEDLGVVQGLQERDVGALGEDLVGALAQLDQIRLGVRVDDGDHVRVGHRTEVNPAKGAGSSASSKVSGGSSSTTCRTPSGVDGARCTV